MQLVERTLNILLTLSKERDGLSVSELAEELNLPSSSTHRILAALKKNNFVIQSNMTKKYRLGYKVLTLSRNIVKKDSLTLTVKPYMEDLADKLNKTIALCVMEGESVICLDFVESKDTSMFMVRIGFPLPAHATSAGKVIQAYMKKDLVEETYLKNHNKFTENTLEDLELFLKELERVRINGYAISDEELQIGVQGVACPIFDYNGKVIASISFTALKSDNSLTRENIEILKKYADNISKSIGGQ